VYSVAGTYVAAESDGIENIQFTDATHYTMLRNVCTAGDSCWESGTYALAVDGTSIAFTPTEGDAYTYSLAAAADDESSQVGGVSIRGGVNLTPGGATSLGAGGAESLAVAESVLLIGFAMDGKSFHVPNAKDVNVGFASPSHGEMADLTGIKSFWGETKYQPGARICHVYLPWDLATNPGAATQAIAADFTSYLASAKTDGGCEEILVSFKTQTSGGCPNGECTGETHGNPSTPTDYGTAFKAFLARWGSEASFAFSPWNEPNNRAGAGNGTGNAGGNAYVIEPATAAQYYLELRSICGTDCKVVAADLASDGTCYNEAHSTKLCIEDYQQNCPNDVVDPSKLCAKASYLDKYKNALAHYAKPYGFAKTFRPEYFAFHGWKEVNDFVYGGNKTCKASNCATEAMVESLGGSWRHAAIWDTEVGAGQNTALNDRTQAQGIGFLLDVSAGISSRIYRVYYMGVRGGGWDLICSSNGKPRPGFKVLATRSTSYGGTASDVCK
jgi:hypothetical protein